MHRTDLYHKFTIQNRSIYITIQNRSISQYLKHLTIYITIQNRSRPHRKNSPSPHRKNCDEEGAIGDERGKQWGQRRLRTTEVATEARLRTTKVATALRRRTTEVATTLQNGGSESGDGVMRLRGRDRVNGGG
ncbi:somatomedin-B and thrombospondin type-1 domain-containing protein-like [Sesbania bispinosa]|nr:somatomedin-B and thrombospondin type-1 domain-containing protein-like [Sesbania bispinosa]